jgi:hypothetical protein
MAFGKTKRSDSDPSEQEQTQKEQTASIQKKPRGRGKFFLYGFVTGIVFLSVVFGTAFYMGAFSRLHSLLFPNQEPVITEAFISGRLEDASELVTAKYIYSGIVDYEEGAVPILNRTTFSMYYTGTVRAGITDMSSVKPVVEEDKVIITLPASTILDVNIHSSSLRFFDQKEGLIHTNSRDQVAKLLTEAEKDVRDADMSDLLDLADEQMENVVRGLFEDSIGDRELVINHETRVELTPGDSGAKIRSADFS